MKKEKELILRHSKMPHTKSCSRCPLTEVAEASEIARGYIHNKYKNKVSANLDSCYLQLFYILDIVFGENKAIEIYKELHIQDSGFPCSKQTEIFKEIASYVKWGLSLE